jgi:hypothetical protein
MKERRQKEMRRKANVITRMNSDALLQSPWRLILDGWSFRRKREPRQQRFNMGTLHRWSILLAFVAGIFACTQKSAPGFKPNSEPDGFAGIKWATEFSEVKSDMVESSSISNPTEPDVKIKIFYTKKGDPLRMGEAHLDKIEYGFWKGKFAEVRITASGSENFDLLIGFSGIAVARRFYHI